MDRREDTHRHDEDHRQRQRECLVLRGKYQEDQHNRHEENEGRGIARGFLLQRKFGPLIAETLGQLRRIGFHRRQRSDRRDARGRRPLDFGRGKEVEPNNANRSRIVLERGDRPKRNHGATCRAHFEIGDIGNIFAQGRFGLRGHAEGAAEHVEVVHVGRSQIRTHRAENFRRFDAEHERLLAINFCRDVGTGSAETWEDSS